MVLSTRDGRKSAVLHRGRFLFLFFLTLKLSISVSEPGKIVFVQMHPVLMQPSKKHEVDLIYLSK